MLFIQDITTIKTHGFHLIDSGGDSCSGSFSDGWSSSFSSGEGERSGVIHCGDETGSQSEDSVGDSVSCSGSVQAES